ncbi:MAG TPA: GerMN domain-containing protein [Pedococcus sp.]|nr:GerMN domain-containing protein [Pedococcus sp.]
MSNNPSERAPEEPRAAEAAQWLWPAAAVVGALFVTALSLLLFTGGGDEDLGAGSGAPAGASSTTSTTRATGAPGVTVETRTTGTGTPSGSPPATTTRSGAGSTTTVPPASLVTVPVYYVMDVEGVGPRLYREFHRVPAQGDQVRSALAEMFAGSPRDPDYRSLWPPSTRVLGVAAAGGSATVDLSGFVSLGAAFESAAVQQLVHTVTAAAPAFTQVTLRVNGQPPPSGHVDWSGPVTRARGLEALGNVWILAPDEGATVRSPVTVTVYGTGWGGSVPLKVFAGAEEIASTSVTTSLGGFAQAHTTVALPPGAYEVRAYNVSGLDETLQLWDSKGFTVR